MFKIIDNKKVEMTHDESELYEKICKSYDTQTSKGTDLFIDLFETNDDGIIIFIKPPSKRYTSMEVFLFVITLMNQQHLRLNHKIVEDIANEMKAKLKEVDAKLSKLS